MSAITHCPSCQTQFIVTETQLNQHNGQVRCGYCLHVFNAKNELVESNMENDSSLAPTDDLLTPKAGKKTLGAFIKNSQDRYFNAVNSLSKNKTSVLTYLLVTALVFTAMAQSIYFLRSDIAIYYPNTKAYLIQVCKKIGCTIDLPKKIELIVIDDSDMQEDENYLGLIHLSSTLINQAKFSQAYPNIEVTLTDTNDTPKLRRIFKPNDYLPNQSDILKGLAAGEEVKVKLAITSQEVVVAGYRIFLSY